jgi:hypothetical protein
MPTTQQLRFDGRRRGNGAGSKPGAFAVIHAATMLHGLLITQSCARLAGLWWVSSTTATRMGGLEDPVPTIRWVKLLFLTGDLSPVDSRKGLAKRPLAEENNRPADDDEHRSFFRGRPGPSRGLIGADRRFRRASVPFMELTGGNCHKIDLAIIVYQAHNSSKPSASGNAR